MCNKESKKSLRRGEGTGYFGRGFDPHQRHRFESRCSSVAEHSWAADSRRRRTDVVKARVTS